MLNEFERVIKSKKGALIFAVMGGKLSEGINFADDMGRGVITIGLPYANINEIEIKEQVQAYVNLMRNSGDEKVKTFQELQSDYLDNSCMRVINQSIGNLNQLILILILIVLLYFSRTSYPTQKRLRFNHYNR